MLRAYYGCSPGSGKAAARLRGANTGGALGKCSASCACFSGTGVPCRSQLQPPMLGVLVPWFLEILGTVGADGTAPVRRLSYLLVGSVVVRRPATEVVILPST